MNNAYACDKCSTLSSPPNGWTQVGKGCYSSGSDGKTYYKLRKNSDHSVYGQYKEDGWVSSKDLTLSEANSKMDNKCGVYSY